MNGEWRPKSPDGKVWMLVDSDNHFVGEVAVTYTYTFPGRESLWWGETALAIGLHDSMSSAARWVESCMKQDWYT